MQFTFAFGLFFAVASANVATPSGGVAIIGVPSTVYDTGGGACVFFQVALVSGTTSTVTIYTDGLTTAVLSAPDPKHPGCNGGKSSSVLRVHAGSEPVRVALWVPESAFPRADTPSTGQIFATDGRSVSNASITLSSKLENPILSSTSEAVRWFWTLGVPALITAAVGYYAFVAQQKYSANKDQERKLKADVAERHAMYDNQFTTWFDSLHERRKTATAWCDELRTKLEDNACFQNMPDGARAELQLALAQRNQTKVKEILVRLYPDWKKDILKSRA